MLERNRPFIKVDVTENINQKFDTIDENFGEITQQLAQKVTKEELNALGKLQLSGTFTTLVELENAYPNGTEGLFLVIEDGYTYRWNGSVWVQAVQFQSTGIGDKSITEDKTTFIILSINLFNPNDSDLIENRLLGATGNLIVDARFFITGFIPVEPGDKYTFPILPDINRSSVAGYYNANKEWIGKSNTLDVIEGETTRTITIPSDPNIKYMRVNGRNNTGTVNCRDTFMIVKGTQYPTEYIPYTPPKLKEGITLNDTQREEVQSMIPNHFSMWAGATANFLGDSITYGSYGNYVNVVKDILGLAKANNYGIGGSRLCYTGDPQIDDAYPPLISRYKNIDMSADINFILIGTNDYSSQVPIGNNDSTSEYEFKGALNIMMDWFRDNFPDKLVIFSTILHRYNDNQLPIKADEYREAIRERCEAKHFVLFDAYKVTGFDFVKAYYDKVLSNDGLHPNQRGAEILGRKIASFINIM